MTRSTLKLAALSLALSSFVTDAPAQGLFGWGSRSNEAAPAPAQSAPAARVQSRTGSATEAPPADLDSALLKAQLSRRAGDFGEAIKILSQLVLFAPDDPRVIGEYGKTLAAQGRSDDALAFLERAIQLDPREWSFHSALGVAHDQKGEYQLAQVAYRRALLLKPDEPAVLNNAALSYLQSGDIDTADRMARQADVHSTDKSRVQHTIALVERLKATRPRPVESLPPSEPYVPAEPMPPPAQEAPPPAVIASLPPPPPQEMPIYIAPNALSAAPAGPLSAPADPIIDNTPVASSALPPLEDSAFESGVDVTPPAPAPSSTLASLQANPTVRMQAVPRDDLAGPVPVRPEMAPPAAAPRATAPPRQLSVGTNASPRAPATRTTQAAPPPKPQAYSAYYVQAGAFAAEDRADRLAASLNSMGARVSPITVGGKPLYRVRIGPFKDAQQANDALDVAKSMGHTDVKVVGE